MSKNAKAAENQQAIVHIVWEHDKMKRSGNIYA